MLNLSRRGVLAFGAGASWMALSGFSPPAKPIKLALQEGGTASWEAAAMQALNLDEHHGVKLEITGVADSRGGQVALQGGKVDMMLSDFVWTSIQRHQGADFTFVPHSLAVGGLMVLPGGPVSSIEDLPGKTVAIAGGPVDKSYVVTQAYYNAKTGRTLPDDITAKFGAPPLVNELLASGQAQASLNFWHFNARAKVAGATELIGVQQMLAELGVSTTPPLLGWVFSEATARKKNDVVVRYLEASFATKAKLLEDDGLWDTIRPAMNVGDNDALFVVLRDAYRAGILTHYGPAQIEAAAQSFALMAKYGGTDLVGDVTELAPGTFWDGFSV